jgi:hypothetical protein
VSLAAKHASVVSTAAAKKILLIAIRFIPDLQKPGNILVNPGGRGDRSDSSR